jgi:outer membrane PBP1 activator LpoA protein
MLRCILAPLAAAWALSAHAQAPANAPEPAAAGAPRPIYALVLPGADTPFARAADALRQGFFAANKAARSPVDVQVIELAPGADALGALNTARERGARVAVGPLPRPEVASIAALPALPLPVVALNVLDHDNGLPGELILMGLPAEDEARRLVAIALAEFAGRVPGDTARPRFLVLATDAPLERRIAQAYTDALTAAGERSSTLTVRADLLEPLAQQITERKPEAVFLALDARSAALVRSRLPREAFVFATSLANPGNPEASADARALARDLEGVRFVDAPWLIDVAGPGVVGVARPAAPLSALEERLYALGIDAYRVARLWAEGKARFELDGATGFLRLDRARSARVERRPRSAILQNGAIEREDFGR